MINELQEKRNKLMTDAAVILRSENPSNEQIDSANKMIAEAGELEQRTAQLKAIEKHEAEQRAFVPAPRSAVTGEVDQRARTTNAIRTYLRTGQTPDEYRDLLTTGSSGLTVPQLFDKNLISALKNFAPMLDIVDYEATAKNGAPIKKTFVNYTSAALTLVPEGTVFPEMDPAFTSAVSNVTKYGGMVKISFEQLSDSGFDLATWLVGAWGGVYGRTLEALVTNGDGGNIASLLGLATTGTTSGVSGVISYSDVSALYGSLTAAYTVNASFMMSTATRAALMGLVATTGNPIFDASPASGPFSSIFGRPVVINDSMPTMAAGHKAILFGDFKNAYYLRTDGAPEIKRLDERFADSDECGLIMRTRVGSLSKNAGIAPLVALTVHA